MKRVTIDSELGETLAEAKEPVRVYDDRGRFLGLFRSESYQQLRDEALAECPATESDLKARASRWEGRPLADILEDLERRAPST